MPPTKASMSISASNASTLTRTMISSRSISETRLGMSSISTTRMAMALAIFAKRPDWEGSAITRDRISSPMHRLKAKIARRGR